MGHNCLSWPIGIGFYAAPFGILMLIAALLEETLALLQSDRYALELQERRMGNRDKGYYTDRYDFLYTASAEELTLLKDDPYHVQLAVSCFPKADQCNVSIHFSPEYAVEVPVIRTSTDVRRTASDGTSIEFFDREPNVAEHAKKNCFTCGGDGDCPDCNNCGYEYTDRIKHDCTRCSSGKCPTCKGSGKRD